MRSSWQKKCPACFSEAVSDTGRREKSPNLMSFGASFNAPVYRCNRCNSLFIYMLDRDEEIDNYNSDDLGGGMPY